MDKEVVVHCILIQWNIIQPLKGVHLSQFNEVDEPRAYYTE